MSGSFLILYCAVLLYCVPHSIIQIMSNEFMNSQILELRRGTIVVATLSLLRSPHYGYGLLQELESAGVPVDAGTLYPLLRRLEKQGILDSSWETTDARPRKYYHLNQEGKRTYDRLIDEWATMIELTQRLLKKEQ